MMRFSIIQTPAAPSTLSLLFVVALISTCIFLALSETKTSDMSTKEAAVYEYEYSALVPVRRGLSFIDEEEELPPLFPFEAQDYVGFSVAILGLLLAAGGGIGGGGILVPTYILLLEFPVKHAIPLASATVFGGAIANNLLNARKMHPDHPYSRPLIDWDLILQLEPLTIWGALIGATLNDYLPDLVLIIMMVLLLALTAHMTLTKAHKMYVNETNEALMKANEQRGGEGMPLVVDKDDIEQKSSSYNAISSSSSTSSEEPDADAKDKTAEEPKKRIRAQVQMDAIKLTALFVVVTVFNILKGGPGEGGGPAGLDLCGVRCFWNTQLLLAGLILMFAAVTRWSLLRRTKSEEGVVLSDITWDEDNTITYPLMAVVAGLVAGLFGVGGGIIKGPLMLALGVHPAVASATSACMILFTSSTATVSYMIFGLLVKDYALFCLAIGFVSTIVGQGVMTILMERYQRSSYIAYSVGGVVGLSAIAMGIESVLAIMG